MLKRRMTALDTLPGVPYLGLPPSPRLSHAERRTRKVGMIIYLSCMLCITAWTEFNGNLS